MNIWNDDNSTYTLSSITSEDIKLAEEHFKVKLPDKYIDLLKIKNGGTLRYNALPFSLNGWEEDDFILIEYIHGIKKDEGIMQTDYYLKEWEINKERVILLSGDGHEWLALDYSTSEEPKVVYILTDEDEVIELYETFSKMLKALYIEGEEVEGNFEEDDDTITYTIEEARRLINSNNKIEVLTGIEAFNNLSDDQEILAENLDNIRHFLKHSDKDIVEFAGESAWSLVYSDYEIDEEFIKFVSSVYKGRTDIPSFPILLARMNNHLKLDKQ
ncbi:SMI1/KNR4 family protein [Niallia circulans]|uniref:SMI1/KNR4 family protein n=1 Tax=Niallia circulans TaxID=1397 RepID=UPI0026F1A06E|nr:SMI1/KNR4 family protein [Niallia circulans]